MRWPGIHHAAAKKYNHLIKQVEQVAPLVLSGRQLMKLPSLAMPRSSRWARQSTRIRWCFAFSFTNALVSAV
jgi:hypothetical protein